MNLIKIGSYNTPPPVSYSVTASDLDSSESGRSESGYMSRERIRGGVKKTKRDMEGYNRRAAGAYLRYFSAGVERYLFLSCKRLLC